MTVGPIAGLHSEPAGPRQGAVLRSFAGRQLLFFETRQAIYELDPISAQIWRWIEAGSEDQVIIERLVGVGSDRDDARTRLDAVCEIRAGSSAPK